jgi:hypothetical protein
MDFSNLTDIVKEDTAWEPAFDHSPTFGVHLHADMPSHGQAQSICSYTQCGYAVK